MRGNLPGLRRAVQRGIRARHAQVRERAHLAEHDQRGRRLMAATVTVTEIDSCAGVDPGPTTGICLLDYAAGRLIGKTVLQVDGGSAAIVLGYLLAGIATSAAERGVVIGRRAGSVERWVEGPAAGRKHAKVTRQIEMECAEALELFGYPVRIRPAADVKPRWTSKRLVAAGLAADEKGLTDDLRHGWDAARHCLCGAREAGIIADPLLRRAPGTV